MFASALVTVFFFFSYAATTVIYTLSLHDALPICLLDRFCDLEGPHLMELIVLHGVAVYPLTAGENWTWFRQDKLIDCYPIDRKSTRLNSSHTVISYAVFCLKKKKRPLKTIPDSAT